MSARARCFHEKKTDWFSGGRCHVQGLFPFEVHLIDSRFPPPDSGPTPRLTGSRGPPKVDSERSTVVKSLLDTSHQTRPDGVRIGGRW